MDKVNITIGYDNPDMGIQIILLLPFLKLDQSIDEVPKQFIALPLSSFL